MPPRLLPSAAALAGLLVLCACGSGNVRPVAEDEYQDPRYKDATQGRLFGDSGLVFGVGKGANSNGRAEEGGALGVNAYLWRGALDTLGFMPLASADPFGGVIITDWYSPPGAGAERFKATAYVMGRQLRSDGVRISVFRQIRQGQNWVDAVVAPATALV